MHGTRNVTGSSARRGKNIFTPYQLRFAVQEALVRWGIIADGGAQFQNFSWDFTRLLDSVLPHLSGYGSNQRGDFTFGLTVTGWKVIARQSAAGERGVFLQHQLGYLENLDSGWLPCDQQHTYGYEIPLAGLQKVVTGFHASVSPVLVPLTHLRESVGPGILAHFEGGMDAGVCANEAARCPAILDEWRQFVGNLPTSSADFGGLNPLETDFKLPQVVCIPSSKTTDIP